MPSILAHLKSLPQWPEKKEIKLTPQSVHEWHVNKSRNDTITEIESILAKEDMPERLDRRAFCDYHMPDCDGRQGGDNCSCGLWDICSKFSAPKTEVDYVGKCPECNNFGHIKLRCEYHSAPKTLSVEEILNIIECPLITPAHMEPVWWVSKGRKELATAIHSAMNAKEGGLR